MYQTKAVVNMIDDKDSMRLFPPIILWVLFSIGTFFAAALTGKPWLFITFAVIFLMIIPVIIITIKIRKSIDKKNLIPRDDSYEARDGVLFWGEYPLTIKYLTATGEIDLSCVKTTKIRYGKMSFLCYKAKIEKPYVPGLLNFLDDNGIPYDEV